MDLQTPPRRPLLLTAHLLALALSLSIACNDTREGSGTDEGDACSVPQDCDDGFDCIEGECRVDDDECDCAIGFEECVDGVCEPVEVVTAVLTHEDAVTGSSLDGASVTVCAQEPVGADEGDVEILLRDDECSAVRVGPDWQPTHEPVEADLGTVTLAVNGGEPIEVPKDDSGLDFLRGCYNSHEGIHENAPVFRPGDDLELGISGSADFPQLSLDASVPEAIEPISQEFVGGNPLPVTWQPAANADLSNPEAMSIVVERRVPGDSYYVACRAIDDGEFTIPAKFTSLLPASGDYTLQVRRRHAALLNHDESTRPIFVQVRTEVDNIPLYSE